jgi:hypothetical protein
MQYDPWLRVPRRALGEQVAPTPPFARLPPLAARAVREALAMADHESRTIEPRQPPPTEGIAARLGRLERNLDHASAVTARVQNQWALVGHEMAQVVRHLAGTALCAVTWVALWGAMVAVPVAPVARGLTWLATIVTQTCHLAYRALIRSLVVGYHVVALGALMVGATWFAGPLIQAAGEVAAGAGGAEAVIALGRRIDERARPAPSVNAPDIQPTPPTCVWPQSDPPPAPPPHPTMWSRLVDATIAATHAIANLHHQRLLIQ